MSIGHPVTAEQVAYIREHFKDTPNETIAKALGLSRSTVCRVARRYRLKKTPEYNQAMWRAAGMASSAARGGAGFGNYSPESIAKRVETRGRRFREEKARWVWGLPLRTKMKVKKQPKRKCSQRAYLKRMGYILDEVNNIAFYTESTHRAVKMERNWDRKRNYYKFMPYEQQREPQGEPVAD